MIIGLIFHRLHQINYIHSFIFVPPILCSFHTFLIFENHHQIIVSIFYNLTLGTLCYLRAQSILIIDLCTCTGPYRNVTLCASHRIRSPLWMELFTSWCILGYSDIMDWNSISPFALLLLSLTVKIKTLQTWMRNFTVMQKTNSWARDPVRSLVTLVEGVNFWKIFFLRITWLRVFLINP